MSDLSPECAPKRTSADHSELWVHALVIEFWRLSIFTATSGTLPDKLKTATETSDGTGANKVLDEMLEKLSTIQKLIKFHDA
jgi:hypothetical protein